MKVILYKNKAGVKEEIAALGALGPKNLSFRKVSAPPGPKINCFYEVWALTGPQNFVFVSVGLLQVAKSFKSFT